MSTSNQLSSGGIATFSIIINGQAIPDELSVFSIHVEKKINRIGNAKIVVLDELFEMIVVVKDWISTSVWIFKIRYIDFLFNEK